MAPALEPPAKTSWADDGDIDDLPPDETHYDEETGIKTVTVYSYDDYNRKVKIVRRFKCTLIKDDVNHAVAERKKWTRFGKNNVDSLVSSGEEQRLKLVAGNKSVNTEEEESAKLKQQLGDRKVSCRTCQGAHFTAHCPFKDQLGGLSAMGLDKPAETKAAEPAAPGVYVPVHKRGGAGGRGETMDSRDDASLRVSNLSEDAVDQDLYAMFTRFGNITRLYVGRDMDTGLCKGYAYVSFDKKSDAEEAMSKINGMPYDHLILSVSWSVPRGERRG